MLIIISLAIIAPISAIGDSPKGVTDDKTLQGARNDLLGKWKNVRSVTATIKSKTYIEYDDGYTDITGIGRYEFLKHDGKDHVRTHIKLVVINRKEQQVFTDRKEVTTYDDGIIMYTVVDEGDEQFASKELVVNRSAMDPIWVFEDMSKFYELERLPDVQLQGETAYVIQGTPKKKESLGQVAMYLSQANAAMLKYEVYDQNGKVLSTTTYSDIALNAKLKIDRFIFKPPAGLIVEDRTMTPIKPEEAKTTPDQE